MEQDVRWKQRFQNYCKAFAAGIIENGDVWMDMIASRNVSINSYEDKVANKILEKSVSFYYEAFKSLKLLFEKKL